MRVTRSAARNQKVKEGEQAEKLKELEQERVEAEKWVKEGRVINPKFPDPPEDKVQLWKLFINSTFQHPNILAHKDVQCIRDLFMLLGGYVTYETASLIIELDDITYDGDRSFHSLQPYRESSTGSSLSCVFGKIESFQVIPNTNACLIQDYRLMTELKSAVEEFVDFFWTYPEALLYPRFAFVHDFLIRFGVSPDAITYEVYLTQRRREEGRYPASTFLLKLGVPESDGSKEEYMDDSECDTFATLVCDWQHMENNGRRSSGSLSDDSGFGTESSDSATSSPIKGGGTHSNVNFVTATKSKVEVVYSENEEDPSDPKKSFQCTVCGRYYVSKGNCNWHIRKRHPGAPLLPGSKTDSFLPDLTHYCKICGKGFTAIQYLRNHVERLHPSESKKNPRNIYNLTLKSETNQTPAHSRQQHYLENYIASRRNSTAELRSLIRRSMESPRKWTRSHF